MTKIAIINEVTGLDVIHETQKQSKSKEQKGGEERAGTEMKQRINKKERNGEEGIKELQLSMDVNSNLHLLESWFITTQL